VQSPVEPEAGFILEQDYSTTRGRFFLIEGSRVRSQVACFSRSAFAKRLRGR
jgi:hypothetical protein